MTQDDKELMIRADKLLRSKPTIQMLSHEDGSVTCTTIELDAPTDEMLDLFADELPFLTTGLIWDSLSPAERLQTCTAANLPASAVLTSDLVQILPARSLAFVEGWQALINEGSVWNTSGFIGRQARGLIDEGFCLHAHVVTEGVYCTGPSRAEIRAGTPGSVAFMRHMMGEAYATRLAAVP